MLYVVGIGPGDLTHMTYEAADALRESEVVIGYTVYIGLVREWLGEKQYLSTPMTQETQRCLLALQYAARGYTVSLICSGDAGVYGLAGLVLELAGQEPEVEIRIIAGVSAALSGAALLGAPLIHDFAVISLSDRLTPWNTIEKRLKAAAEADFEIVLYNPSSKSRPHHLRRACEILLAILPAERVCGIAWQIGRDKETTQVLSLGELKNTSTDMFATIFIGNQRTILAGGRMITPRGYDAEH